MKSYSVYFSPSWLVGVNTVTWHSEYPFLVGVVDNNKQGYVQIF